MGVSDEIVIGPDSMQERRHSEQTTSGEGLLFLTDDQLRKGIEAMFFAYRGFTADPDLILETLSLQRQS